MINILERIVDELKLGTLTMNPEQITGGLTHRIFKIITNKGKYIIKLLNPNIMKRSSAIENFNMADKLEETLKKNNISAIYSLIFNNKKMQSVDGQYFYIYEWFDGKVLNNNKITKFHCELIGEVLANIHNIDLQNDKFEKKEIHIDWDKYLKLSEENNSIVYDLLKDKIELLKDIMNKGNIAIKKIPNVKAICHNNMDSKNVMWLNDKFKIIDLECLGYNNPYLELFELALCWSGYDTCNINFGLFNSFLKSYFKNSKLNTSIDWENLYYSNYGRLEWLEFNIKRSLMIECDTKEEQELGLTEVKATLELIVYYDKVKNNILDNIKKV